MLCLKKNKNNNFRTNLNKIHARALCRTKSGWWMVRKDKDIAFILFLCRSGWSTLCVCECVKGNKKKTMGKYRNYKRLELGIVIIFVHNLNFLKFFNIFERHPFSYPKVFFSILYETIHLLACSWTSKNCVSLLW